MIMKRESRNLTLLLSSSVEEIELRMTSPAGLLERKKSTEVPTPAEVKKRLHRNNTIMDKIKDIDRRNSLGEDDPIREEEGLVDKPLVLRGSARVLATEG